MNKYLVSSAFVMIWCAGLCFAGDGEFTGQFDPALVPNREDLEKVVLKGISFQQLKGKVSVSEESHLAAGRLSDPRTGNHSILTLLVEEVGEDPYIIADLNSDGTLGESEKVLLKRVEENNPFLWDATIEVKLVDGLFKSLPIYFQYFKKIKLEKMGPEDRLVRQSTEVMARARVAVNGKNVLLQYTYDAGDKKVDPQNGWLGVDADGDGDVDIGDVSPESTKADQETVVFRSGDVFVSTKKADIGKNLVIVKLNHQKDYKRAELWRDKEFPQFSFTDFEGKKRNFSEFRGKYVLLDVWGFWCPACRDELPYLREANRRYQARGLVILGLNTDEDYTVDSMKNGLNKAGMNWTHAQFSSVIDFLRVNLRLHSFPSTFLISPEGKILSMNRVERGEASLRGRSLLETLDEVLPPI